MDFIIGNIIEFMPNGSRMWIISFFWQHWSGRDGCEPYHLGNLYANLRSIRCLNCSILCFSFWFLLPLLIFKTEQHSNLVITRRKKKRRRMPISGGSIAIAKEKENTQVRMGFRCMCDPKSFCSKAFDLDSNEFNDQRTRPICTRVLGCMLATQIRAHVSFVLRLYSVRSLFLCLPLAVLAFCQFVRCDAKSACTNVRLNVKLQALL